VRAPLVRRAGKLETANYDTCLNEIVRRLASGQLATDRRRAVGVISGRLRLETLAGFRQFMNEVIGSDRAGLVKAGRHRAVRDALGSDDVGGLALVEDLDEADLYLCVGADPAAVQDVAAQSIRRGVYDRKAMLIEVNPRETGLSRLAKRQLRVNYGGDGPLLRSLLKNMAEYSPVKARLDEKALAALEQVDEADLVRVAGVDPETVRMVAAELVSAKRPVVMAGSGLTCQGAAAIRDAINIAAALGTDGGTSRLGMMFLLNEANSRAATRLGLDWFDVGDFDAYTTDMLFMVLGDDPCGLGDAALEGIRKVPHFVLMTSYENELCEMAEVVLPSATWSERSGRFLNLEGRIQQAEHLQDRPAEVRDEAEVFAGLAKRLGMEMTSEAFSSLPEDLRDIPPGHLLSGGAAAEDMPIRIL